MSLFGLCSQLSCRLLVSPKSWQHISYCFGFFTESAFSLKSSHAMICGGGPLKPCAEAAWLIFCCLSGAISVQRLLAKQGSPITWEPCTPTTFLIAKVVGKNQSIIYSLTVTLFPWSSLQSSEDPLLSPAFPGYWSWAALLFWNIFLLLFLQARLHSPSPVVHMSLGLFSGSWCSVTEGQVTIKLFSRSCFLGRAIILLRWRQAYF